MKKCALIRVWNDECDLTYVTSMYEEEDHEIVMQFAKNQCRRWMNDNFGIQLEESEDVNVEFLFDFVCDGILHNDYFKSNLHLKEE